MRKVRANELAAARAEIDRARRGEGRSVWISGPAGIGKTAFLGELLRSSSSGWRIVRVDGAEQESRMVWAGVSQLLHRLRSVVDELGPAHRRILESLVDPGAEHAPDAFAAAISVHALVARAAETEPTMIVVEDRHWLDPDSVRVLDFVARRLDGLRTVVLSTTRADEGPGGLRIALQPLGEDEAAGVLSGLGVSTMTARQLVRRVGGHPLSLVHVARSLTSAQRSGTAPLPSPLPVAADDLPSALGGAIAHLPADTLRWLHLLAAAGACGRDWPKLAEVAGLGVDSLAPAEEAGVIVVDADGLRFTHPMFRAVAYADASPPRRRAAHAALATLQVDPVRALWHRSRAVCAADDDVAAGLDRVARDALEAGAANSAFEAWHRAAELCSSDASAHTYEVLAAGAALRAGNIAPARELIARRPPDATGDPELVLLAADYEARAGHVDAAYELYVRAGDLLDAESPDRAAGAFLDAARTRLRVGHIGAAGGALERLAALVPHVTDGELARRVEVVRAFVDAMSTGDDTWFMAACRAIVPPSDPMTGDLAFIADVVALALAFTRHRTEALALVERLHIAVAERNLPSLVPHIDTAKACALNTTDLPGCLIAASSAVEWADEIGQPNLASAALGYLANVQAALGDSGVFASAARIGAAGTEHAWVTERMMRGFYWLTLGQPERVLDELLPLHEWSGGELKTVLFWQGDLGEAAARAGRADLAAEMAVQLRRFDEVFPNPWLAGAAARLDGLLADVDECGASFAASVEAFARGDILLGEARSELLWGERLRRARRRSEARVHLSRARELFERIGAGRWIERCDQELVAAGGVAQPPDHSLDADRVLTPQELQIARHCVAGRSNRDIGAALFISGRTVETHLSAIYRKLGVKNRAELAAAASHDPALRDPSR